MQWERSLISISRSTEDLRTSLGGILHTDRRSRSGRRTIPLPPQAMEALQVQQELQQGRGRSLVEGGFVLTPRTVGRCVRPMVRILTCVDWGSGA